MSSVLLLILFASFCPVPAPPHFLPTVSDLSRQTKDEAIDRSLFWVVVMISTYLTTVGVGTVIMKFQSRVLQLTPVLPFAHDENVLHTVKGQRKLVGFVFFTTFTTCLTAVIWSISTSRLSKSTGLDYEVYWVLLTLNCLWMLLQATIAKCKSNEEHSWFTFAEASLSGTFPFCSDSFDTLRDIMFGGLCFSSEKLVLKVLGITSWLYLALVHVYFLCKDDYCLELQLNYAGVLYSQHKDKHESTKSCCESAMERVLVILYKLTTRTKVGLVLFENSVQAVFAVVFLWLEGGSLLVMIFNLLTPAVHILFALSFHKCIANALIPNLERQLQQAMVDRDSVKVRTVARRILDLGLTELILEDCEIEDVKDLAAVLRDDSTLFQLNLSGNKIKDVSSLADALEKNATLTTLYLGRNKIQDITALANAIKENTALECLLLSENQIEDITALANAIKENTALEVLLLSGNQIEDIDELASAIKENTALQSLHLSGNPIKDITALASALNTNKTLEHLSLFANKIEDAQKLTLREIWEKTRGTTDGLGI